MFERLSKSWPVRLFAAAAVIVSGQTNGQSDIEAKIEAKLDAMGNTGPICKDMIEAAVICELYSDPSLATLNCDRQATLRAQLPPDEAKICDQRAQETIRGMKQSGRFEFKIPKEQARKDMPLPIRGSLESDAHADLVISFEQNSDGNPTYAIGPQERLTLRL